MYHLIVFDMDGTLADTSEGILNSHRHALKMMDRKEPWEKEFDGIIGGNLLQIYTNRFGFSEPDAKEAVKIYREYYAQVGIHQAKLYPDMTPFLKALKKKGMKLGVATLKAERFAKIMLNEMGVGRLFNCICGIDENDSITKAEMIQMCMIHTGCSANETVLVGDSINDAEGAKAAGVNFVGVTYGYGFKSEDDVKGVECLGVAKSIEDLAGLLLGKEKEKESR